MRKTHLAFRELAPKPKTKVWEVASSYDGSVLGQVSWYGPWRMYCFFPAPTGPHEVGGQLVFSDDCLSDLAEFIKAQNTEWKANR